MRDDTKTAAGVRVLPLVPEAAAAIRARKATQAAERLRAGAAWTDSGLVFTTEVGTPIDDRNALRWLHSVRDRAGVNGGGWHAFRHGAATRLLLAGVPMPVVQRVMGHSRIGTTVDLYGHVPADHLAEAMLQGMAGYAALPAPQSDPQSARN